MLYISTDFQAIGHLDTIVAPQNESVLSIYKKDTGIYAVKKYR
jgi:hypothetical protein